MKTVAWMSLALVLSVAGAFGHAMPRAESPGPNAVLAKSPREIRMTFSEAVVAAFSGFKAVVDPNDDAALSAPVAEKLAPGTYIVRWHAVSTDTHRSSGQYRFQVKS